MTTCLPSGWEIHACDDDQGLYDDEHQLKFHSVLWGLAESVDSLFQRPEIKYNLGFCLGFGFDFLFLFVLLHYYQQLASLLLHFIVMTEGQNTHYTLSYSLEGKMITNIKPYLHILNSMPNLRYLSLKNNKIEEIPTEIQELKTIEEIDLSENNLRSFSATLQVLKQLGKLKSLHIDINKSMIDKLKSALPQLQYLNGQQLYTLTQKFNHVDWQPVNPSIQTAYLKELSNIYQLINNVLFDTHSEDSNKQFLQVIRASFSSLAESLGVCTDKGVRAIILVRARTQLQRYCLKQLLKYMAPINLDFKILLEDLLRMQWKEYSEMEKIVLYQLRTKIDQQQLLNTKQITSLKQTIAELNQEVNYLNTRVLDLEKQNAGYLERLIGYSKGNLLSLNGLQHGKKFKDVNLLRNYSSPQIQQQRKHLEASQLQETIYDIYDKKSKHQTASTKKTTMAGFIKTYFLMNFGAKLAEENQSLFKQSLAYQSARETNHNIVLFSKILNSECEEDYLNEVKIINDNLIKKAKVYVRDNQKKIEQINSKKFQYQDLQKILSPKSKQDIKIDVQGLRVLLSELMMSEETIDYILESVRAQRQEEEEQKEQRTKYKNVNSSLNRSKSDSPNKSMIVRMNSLPNEIIEFQYFKKVVNMILNMSLKKHEQKIKQIVVAFKQRDTNNDGQIKQTEFKDMIVQVMGSWGWKDTPVDEKKTVMFHEVIEFMRKGNKKKAKKKEI